MPGPQSELAYYEAVLRDGPIAYWRLQELGGTSAADSSGNNYTGSIVGSVSMGLSGPFGSGSYAMNNWLVTTPNRWVGLPSSPYVNTTGGATIEFWAYLASAHKNDQCSAFTIGNNPSNRCQVHLPYSDSIYWDYGFNWNTNRPTTTIPSSALDAWTYWVFTANDVRGNKAVWCNGTQIVSGAFNGSGGGSLSGGNIGVWPSQTLQTSAELAEFAVYNYCLSDNQIYNHYNAVIPGTTFSVRDPQGIRIPGIH